MATHYPIHFAAQLRQHVKALRKSRQLTQAQLGELLGISQARVAEIEANPGLVKFEQLLQLLSALNVTMVLSEDVPAQQPDARQAIPAQSPSPVEKLPAPRSDNIVQPTSRLPLVVRPKKGTW